MVIGLLPGGETDSAKNEDKRVFQIVVLLATDDVQQYDTKTEKVEGELRIYRLQARLSMAFQRLQAPT